jgi:glycerophosphoryl diester phosphodiesterase
VRLAHRGDWREGPENSLVAIVAGARAARSDGVEIDVRLAADGIPVVIHDRSLRRIHGVDADVAELSASELAAVGVPTLSAALAALPTEALVDVEFKVPPNATAIAILLAAKGPDPDRAIVSSFHPDALVDLAARLPGWPRWLNVERVPGRDDVRIGDAVAQAVALDCVAIAVDWPLITPAIVRLARRSGLDIVAWTVRREPTVRRLERLGVAAAIVEGRPLDLRDDAVPRMPT